MDHCKVRGESIRILVSEDGWENERFGMCKDKLYGNEQVKISAVATPLETQKHQSK